jgi:hypothetical protein
MTDNMLNILDYISLSQAAKLLNYTDSSALRRYCIDKRIPGAVKIARNWLIPKSWVISQQNNSSFRETHNRGIPRK